MKMNHSGEFSTRYEELDHNNQNSWYLTDPERPFHVTMSLHDIGPSREQKIARIPVITNVSPDYGPDSVDKSQWPELARVNLNKFLRSIEIDPATVRILHPNRKFSTPLKMVAVDAENVEPNRTDPTYLQQAGDFIYTFNPNLSLAVRPADCPVVAAYGETPAGPVQTMTHIAWEGAVAGYVDQMFTAYDKLMVDRSTLKIYLTAGGHAENFAYKDYPNNPLEMAPGLEGLFINVRKQVDSHNSPLYSFAIDTPNFVYKKLIDHGIKPDQIFVDTTDTAALDAGTSSNTRMKRSQFGDLDILPEDNSRDVIVVSPEKSAIPTPTNPA